MKQMAIKMTMLLITISITLIFCFSDIESQPGEMKEEIFCEI